MRLVLALVVLLPGIASAQDEARAAAALQQVYAANLMGQAERPGLADEMRDTGAPETVAAFYLAGLQGAAVLDPEYLTLPDRETLRFIFAVDSVHQTSRDEPRPDPAEVAQAALESERDLHALAHTYYRILFGLVGNKIRPFDLSGYDFEPLSLTGGDPELAAIFYLEAIRMSHTHFWGLLRIPNPPNYAGAAEILDGFPRFDGEPYYAYTTVDPGDFSTYIAGEYQPYRAYQLNELYVTLLDHITVLMETGGTRDDALAFIAESAIMESAYYEHFENPDLLAALAEQASGHE